MNVPVIIARGPPLSKTMNEYREKCKEALDEPLRLGGVKGDEFESSNGPSHLNAYLNDTMEPPLSGLQSGVFKAKIPRPVGS